MPDKFEDLLNAQVSNTSLAARTTEGVIADLTHKLLNHSLQQRDDQLSLIYSQQANQSSLKTPSTLSQINLAGYKEVKFSNGSDNDAGDDNEEADDDDDDDDDEIVPVPSKKKLTARKIRINATVEKHMQDRSQSLLKKNIKVRPEDLTQQSTRWLVNQSENHRIISSPREYQVELYEKAKENNIIAVLDTGSGKTLIAVLLLRHIFSQELEDRALGKAKRISFFLVDSVQLVFQQHAVLKANLDQPMDMFCGDMGCDLWSRSLWEKHFAKNMVIVCTSEVLRQCLHHSFISIDRINLLIFDEAHHAKKDHSYARIIKDFYVPQEDRAKLPKIFGMTASPVDARVDVRKAAAELEAILHCEIATAADSSLLQHTIATKQEQLAKYAQLGPEVKTELYLKMYEKLKSNVVLKRPLLYALEASKDLGTWCSDQVWPSCLTEEETKKLLAKTERRYHAKRIQDPMEVLEKHNALLQEAQGILGEHTFQTPDFKPPQCSIEFESYRSSNLSSKVVVLIQFLKERFERPTDDKCIVFVRRRYTAQLLVKLFSHPTIGTPNLFVGALVGTRSGDAGDLNVSFREQVLTMMNFRKGSTEEGGKAKGFINCLFATSVAEEGLDIPDCNLVVRFDLYTTLIQYIQSRGRARHANSRYIHMYEDGNQEHLMMIKEVRQNEGILKRFCNALPEDRKLTGNDFDMDHFLSKEKTHRVYKTPTGAKLNYKISLMVLANFVDSLPRGPDISLQAEYIMTVHNKMFLCEVVLPEAAPTRGAIGRPATTKQVAKCSAAFETCLELVKGKYLDEWLLPIFTKQLPAMRNAHLAVDSKKREAYDMKTKPKLWSMTGTPEELFVTVLKLDSTAALDRPSQPLALLTRARLPQLPSFFVHFGGGRHSSVQFISLTSPVRVDTFQIKQLNNFTIRVFDDVFSKLYESDIPKMPYFLAPAIDKNITADAIPEAVISWTILKSVQDYADKWGENIWDDMSWKSEPNDFFKDKYVIDPYDGSRKMWTVGVAPEYRPLDPVPSDTVVRSGTRKNNNNIQEYSCSLWANARAKRTFDTTQRVIECRFVSLRRNLLDEFDTLENEGSKKLYVILEPLRISPLPTTVVAMAYIFPAIIHRLESYLISMEACELLHLQIRPELALEACTKDSDNSEDHGIEQVNFQRGMGNNYERLEFLGDCFLKMATSISLYGLHPDNDEYSYHVDRMLLICNKNLKDNAMKLKLYEYIRSMSFNRRAWYPEGLVLKKGKTASAPNSHKLGDKSIADVCEAMIGAALLTFHESRNMDNAVRAVTELVCSENHQVIRFADYYKLYKKPKYQIAAATEMQKNLAIQVEQKHGYHFRYPRLLRSAFIHPSYPFSYEHIPSYQRLEFLGDSLLDMACVNFLFHNHPNKDPQWLTEHKMAMVSNQFLGCLCVSLRFHTHLLVFNSTFQKQIADYVTDITEARRAAVEDAIRAGKTADHCAPDFWIHVRQPPKCLPDIMEAYIGAIFVDSEYNFAEVEHFFDAHIKWYFQDMAIYDTYANKQPTTFLTNFLQVNMGCMEWALTHRELPGMDGSKSMVIAMVIVHDQVVADWQAESSRYAKVAAAKEAMGILRGLPLPEFRQRYCCNCRLSEIEEELAEGVVSDPKISLFA